MTNKYFAIRAQDISKCYRIGAKKDRHDNLVTAFLSFLRSPIDNYRKYRSLYRFDDMSTASGGVSSSKNGDVMWALNGVSFNIQAGEIVGIIGRNGAGKSTLLKVLTKITNPTAGFAEIHGRVSSLLEVGTGFHPELTGRDNIYLNGTILGMRKKEVHRKFDEIVAFSGIEKFIDTPVKRYSSGMRVRLAFSVAAHLEPEILIVDEVLAVGDAEFQKKCLNKMEDVGQQGRTVLFVSHNMPALTRLCSRAILLERGQVVEDGPCDQVVSKYLASGIGTSALREWKDPQTAPSGPMARLRAVRVKNIDGKVTEKVDIRRPVLLEMTYDVLESGHVLMPHFRLGNDKGDCVFVTVDQDPEWRRRSRPKGTYTSTAVIPGNLLAEGILLVNCNLMTLNPDELQFSEKNAVSFNVMDSIEGDSARADFAKNIPGVVRPLLEWRTDFISKLI
jgi:lipopolysaccharide transport system ATP-binding protein